MKKIEGLQCIRCGREHKLKESKYNCVSCGGNLDVVYDYNLVKKRFSLKSLAANIDYSIWRYMAIGSRASLKDAKEKGVFFAGDVANGPTTVVEAVASGKNTAEIADAFVMGKKAPKIEKAVKGRTTLAGRNMQKGLSRLGKPFGFAKQRTGRQSK